MARIMVAVLPVTVVFAGCELHSKQRAQEAIDDASISAAVQAKLTADRSSNFALVSVDSDRGVVHLTGVVDSAEQRKRAAELSRQVTGVTHVENSLRIQHSNTTRRFGE
jgi:osmotically-inducible protein OsmY